MVYLHMAAEDFGLSGHDFVKAPYENLEAAQAQADHNRERNVQRPLRIVDESGAVLVNYEEQS
jgi:hypothetical protein